MNWRIMDTVRTRLSATGNPAPLATMVVVVAFALLVSFTSTAAILAGAVASAIALVALSVDLWG